MRIYFVIVLLFSENPTLVTCKFDNNRDLSIGKEDVAEGTRNVQKYM
jgi:hypothetical protein